jgi:general secretion pathway protein K
VLALVFVALLAVLVVGFFYEMEVSASLAENQGSDFQALLAAKSAVANGISLLADDLIETMTNGEPEYDSTMDPSQWAQGLPFEPVNDAMMRTTISDEYGKINLNALIQPNPSGGEPLRNEALITALHNFFALRSQSEKDPVDAIIDWVDFGDMDSEEPEGAENNYYTSLENPYACKNGPMDSIEELLLIKGITPALYFGDTEQNQLPLSEYLTVNGDPNGRINVNTAPEEVLAAVIGVQSGNADIQQAQMIYDEARTQPYEDLSRLAGFTAPTTGTGAGLGTGATGKPGTATKPGGSSVMPGRTGGLLQKSMEDPEKQLGGFSGGLGASGSRTGFGQPALTGTTKPLGNNSAATAANQQQQQRQQQLSQTQQLFRVNSNVFRIYGDGMVDDVLVRIEAYVWRTPLDISELQNGPGAAANQMPMVNPGTTPGVKPGISNGGIGGIGGMGGKPRSGGIMKAATGATAVVGSQQTGPQQSGGRAQTGTGAATGGLMQSNMGNGNLQAMADAYGAPLVPAEPFRILDWKVIR